MGVVDETVDWFRFRGWVVTFSEEEGEWWAHLTSADNPGFVVERYGRGVDQEAAAKRARARWKQEQQGAT